ncbi:hypothetical protein AB1K32_23115 [Metabacillus dongyingensis]
MANTKLALKMIEINNAAEESKFIRNTSRIDHKVRAFYLFDTRAVP